ncbi:MAG: hypothetical protein K0R76_1606 [Alphaproteobacteria bacterium]|jgi:GNAT superfamily N-acetyltransferase|nr:hypothetical protein [Alphaproteobacteria bacterium]
MKEPINIERLTSNHNRKIFDCGEEILNDYIRTQASQDLKKNMSAIYVAVSSTDPLQVIGFYILSATHILFSDLPSEIAQSIPRYPEVPAYRLGRLAVDKAYQGMGIGKTLIMDALYICSNLKVPAAMVIVDAKHQKACSFYLKYGFIQLPEQPLKLFIPMKVIKNTFS